MSGPDKTSIPSDPEVIEQLQRILSSKLFIKLERPAKVLELIVKESLKGHQLSEQQIFDSVYGKYYDFADGHARIAVNTIRKRLTSYNNTSGLKDRVIITLPKPLSNQNRPIKDAYIASYLYNPLRHDTRFNVAFQLLKTLSPRAVHQATDVFRAFIDEHPDHTQAKLAFVECLCVTAIYIPTDTPKASIIDTASKLCGLLIGKFPENWECHLLYSVVHICHHDVPAARTALIRYFGLRPSGEKESLWPIVFYFATGNLRFALQYIVRCLSNRPEDFNVLVAFGFYYYFNREFDQAHTIFAVAQTVDPNSWVLLLGIALVNLALDKPAESFHAYNRMMFMVPDPDRIMPGLGHLITSRAIGKDGISEAPEYILSHTKSLTVPPEPAKDWFQIALVLLDQNPLMAIRTLYAAWHEFHPLASLIPLLPVFDPLKQYSEFEELLALIKAANGWQSDLPEPPERSS